MSSLHNAPGPKVFVAVNSSVAQPFVSGSFDVITFNTVVEDNLGSFSANTFTNTTGKQTNFRITMRFTWVNILNTAIAQISIFTAAGAEIRTLFQDNGDAAGTLELIDAISTIHLMNNGDQIQLRGIQTTGGNRDLGISADVRHLTRLFIEQID